MNVLKMLRGIEATLRRLITWPGWTDQDRIMITDLCRQIDKLQRRGIAREKELKKYGLS